MLMPELGESVTEGTVTRWLKKVGDSVAVDEPLVEVSTDKVDTEIPSPVAGTLVSITAEEDDTVAVGGELAKIGDAGAAPAEKPEPKPEPKEEPKEEPKQEAKEEPKPEPKPKPGTKPEPKPKPEAKPEPKPEPEAGTETGAEAASRAGTVGRRRSLRDATGAKACRREQHRSAAVKGSGVGGRIRKQDVLAAAEAKKAPAQEAPAAKEAPAPAAKAEPAPALAHLRGTTQKANRIRQITAKKTRESLQATAQLTQTHEVDMTKIVALRARAKNEFAEREGVNLTYLPFIARAVIDALKAHPNVNASYNEETKEITYYDAEHLGFAVDTEQGLLSPVIHNAGDLSLAGSGASDRRHRGQGTVGRSQTGRAVRRDVHDHQHRQPGRAVRHPDPGAAAGGDAGHRCDRQTSPGGGG